MIKIGEIPRSSVLFLLGSAIFMFSSCDLLQSSDEAPSRLSAPVTFTLNNQHQQWKDEVRVQQTGEATFHRVKGEDMPQASRMLNENEIKHLNRLLDEFGDSANPCPDFSGESVRIYSLKYGARQTQTFTCGSTALSENEFFGSVIALLRKFRMSLIGEKRFAGQLSFKLAPKQKVVDLDEPITLEYAVANHTRGDVEIGFRSSGQLGYKIYRDGQIMFSSAAFGYAAVITSWTIPRASGEIKTRTWDHSSFDGSVYHDRKVDSGTYTIIQYLQDGNSPYQATEITITEQGEEALQPRVIYNRFDDPSKFTYELNNRISESFSFEFPSKEKVGFRIQSYDVDSHEPGDILYSDTSEAGSGNQLTIEPYENYQINITWNREDHGGAVPSGFYWAEMWVLDQDREYRTGRRVFIKN